jgi:hypothetical protein
MCKQNLGLLTKNGFAFCLKFLKGLITVAKERGVSFRASKVSGIIQRKDSQKQW